MGTKAMGKSMFDEALADLPENRAARKPLLKQHGPGGAKPPSSAKSGGGSGGERHRSGDGGNAVIVSKSQTTTHTDLSSHDHSTRTTNQTDRSSHDHSQTKTTNISPQFQFGGEKSGPNGGASPDGPNGGASPDGGTPGSGRDGWGAKARPGGGELPSAVEERMRRHELPGVDETRRERDAQAARLARSGRDILSDDGFIEYIMGWEDFANTNKDILVFYGYGLDSSGGVLGKAWDGAQNAMSRTWRFVSGGSVGTESLAPALYSMYHWEDSVDFAAIEDRAGLAGAARRAAHAGAQQQADDMRAMGQAWVGEGGEAAAAHYRANKDTSAVGTVEALGAAHAGVAATGRGIAELLDMKKQAVEDLATQLKSVIAANSRERYQQLVDLVRPGLYLDAAMGGAPVRLLAELGVEAHDCVVAIDSKIIGFLGKLADQARHALESARRFFTGAPAPEAHFGADLARKLVADLEQAKLPNLRQAEIELAIFVKALQTAEHGVIDVCDKVHKQGRELLEQLPPAPGARPDPVKSGGSPNSSGSSAPAGLGQVRTGGTGSGGASARPDASSPAADAGEGRGRDSRIGSDPSRSSPPGSAGQSPGSAGQSPGSAGQSPGSAGQSPGSAGQSPGQAVDGLGTALGCVLQALLDGVSRIIQAAAQTARQSDKDKDKDKDQRDSTTHDDTDHNSKKATQDSNQPEPVGTPGADSHGERSGTSARHPAPALSPPTTAPAGPAHAAQNSPASHPHTRNNHDDFEVRASVRHIHSGAANHGHITGFE